MKVDMGASLKIIGTRIRLRDEPQATDDGDFFRWLNLKEWNYYDEPDQPFKGINREDFDQRREERKQHPKPPSPDKHTWQIDTLEGRHIGWVIYYQLDPQAGTAYVGIALPEPETWGKGYGTEALRLLIDYLFREVGLREVHLATWIGNRRMMRVAGKCGLREVGRMPHRASLSVRGEPLERVEYALSKEEWQASCMTIV